MVIACLVSGAWWSYNWDIKVYRTILTVQAYLLIDQYRSYGEQVVRQGDRQWPLTKHQTINDDIVLSCIPDMIKLGDRYETLSIE